MLAKINSKIDPNNVDTFVISKLDNVRYRRITYKHTKRYNLSLKEYCEKFNVNEIELICKELRNGLAVTLDNMISKYGEVEGKIRWDQYREKQAYTNSYEYKKEKYGWNEDDFKEYNLSRAVTLENCIRRHGESEGTKIFEEYVEIQKYVGVKLEYFIEKYGEEEGQEKYNKMIYQKLNNNSTSSFSKVSQEFFKLIDEEGENSFYREKNNEYRLYKKKYKPYSLDFFNLDRKKAIEFFGDYWHMTPKKYSPEYINKSGIMACEKWEKDQDRLNQIKENYGIEVLVVWEGDFYKNPEICVNEARNFLYGK